MNCGVRMAAVTGHRSEGTRVRRRAMVTTDNSRRRGGKRGNGEGSIYQRKSGLWTGQVTLPDGQRKYVYGKTRAEAAKKMTAVLKDAQSGVPVPTGRKSVGAFLADYLTSAKPSIRATTYRSYEQLARV